jgi:hypothetical protein
MTSTRSHLRATFLRRSFDDDGARRVRRTTTGRIAVNAGTQRDARRINEMIDGLDAILTKIGAARCFA